MTKPMRDEHDFDGARNAPCPSPQKNRHLEFTAGQIKEIKLALKEADAGEFASLEDLAKAAKKYAS